MPLAKAYDIYSKATMATSGTVKTVRGPSMSATPGKVQVVGITSIKGEKVRKKTEQTVVDKIHGSLA